MVYSEPGARAALLVQSIKIHSGNMLLQVSRGHGRDRIKIKPRRDRCGTAPHLLTLWACLGKSFDFTINGGIGLNRGSYG